MKMKKLINRWMKSEAYTEYCLKGLHRVLLEYGKNVQLQSRKLNKRIESNGIQSVFILSLRIFVFY